MVSASVGTLFYQSFIISSVMFSTPVEVFRFCCVKMQRKCTLQNWSPKEEGFYVLSHIPTEGNYTLQVINVQAILLAPLFWHGIEHTRHVHVVNSLAVRRIFVPGNCTIGQLTIERTRLSDAYFEDNPMMNNVEILGSALREIVPSLVRLVSLTKLQLRDSYITRLELAQFCNGYENLEYLNLDKNRISSIVGLPHPRPLVPCRSKLRTLLLRDNQLESVNLNLFAPFPNLTELNVSLNKILHVTGHFSNASLASLMFAHNRVKRLGLCDWDVLQEVTELSVAYNNLTRIPDCLWMLPNVSSLYLQGNQIAVFDENQFYGMTNLELLNLAYNKLSSVTIDPAKLPASLLQLHLYRNCLCSLNVSDQQLRAMGNLMIYLNKMSANRFINEESDCHRC